MMTRRKQEYNRRYYQGRKEEMITYAKKYYWSHKDDPVWVAKQRKYTKDWRIRHAEERNRKERERKVKIKLEVLSHYSPNLICQRCGFDKQPALTIDHINGNGNKHRMLLGHGRRGGGYFYQWLKNNAYPEGYQVLCMNCQFIKMTENGEWGGALYPT